MKYDFTSIIDRRGRDAIAVDGLKGDGFSPAPRRKASMPSPCGWRT